MRAALAAHDKVLRTAIESHGGLLFKHTGDGVIAAFVSPRSAVDAAVVAQRELGLPVRMGIATGEAALQEGDYFGSVLNRAARVMAAGHGGQILVADSTASLVSGIDLIDLGLRRLRDVPAPVGLFQVRATGLREDFPQLRALGTSPGNLRPATTSFIGRESEVADVKDALRAHRLVTLTGVGGVGKTRLALEVAAQVAAEFPDGVWIFELAAVGDAAAVPDAVASVLGITQQPGKTVLESVATALEGRVRLLLLDNCEHILDAVGDLVEAIRAQSATVKLLATSREGLGLGEEQLWPVQSLGVETAVALFVERAHNVAPQFTSDQVAVAEVCRRLDGIPLAIELAASRMASMTAAEVRDRLDDRFRLLVGSRRSLNRHQTLRHAVAWSYDLLDDTEKSLLDRCSVFAGGFDLESIRAAAGFGGTDDYVILDLLDSLVRKSLLVVDRSADRTRFSMLETIRQFAEDQLVARGAATEARHAHARHFADREADILALWDSPRQREAYAWFTAELANLRAAFRWVADQGNLDDAAIIATYAGFLGFLVDNYEPIAWAEELIESARAADHPRLAFLYLIASMCWIKGRIEDAVGYADAAQAVITDDCGELPFAIQGWLGSPYGFTAQPDRAVECYRTELARGRDTHTSTRSCLVIALAGVAADHKKAMAEAKGLVEAAEATHNQYAISFALTAEGLAFRNANPDRARRAMRRGLAIAHDSGNHAIETHLMAGLALLEANSGDPLAALEFFAGAIRHYHDAGNPANLRSTLGALAAFLVRLGLFEPAATIAGFAVDPLSAAWIPEINPAITQLREVLGDEVYLARSRSGETMTAAAIAKYAYEQIDEARATLEQLP